MLFQLYLLLLYCKLFEMKNCLMYVCNLQTLLKSDLNITGTQLKYAE